MYEEMLIKARQPLLIVVSGPSGVGKDTVIDRMKKRGLPFHFVITATSRPRRQNEVEDRDYFFVSREEFHQMIENDELFEHALVYGEYKGIPKKQVEAALASEKDVVMRVDVQGAETIRQQSPEAILIFLATANENELLRRLKARRTESPDKLALRIETSREEMKRVAGFDYYVVNRKDKLDETVDCIVAIITTEHARTQPRAVNL